MLLLAITGELKSDISCGLKLYQVTTHHLKFIVKIL